MAIARASSPSPPFPPPPPNDAAIYVDSSRPGTRAKLLRQLVMRANCSSWRATVHGNRCTFCLAGGGSFSGKQNITRRAIRDSRCLLLFCNAKETNDRKSGRGESYRTSKTRYGGERKRERRLWIEKQKRGKRIGHGIQRAAILRAGLHKMHCNPCSQCGKLKFYLLV